MNFYVSYLFSLVVAGVNLGFLDLTYAVGGLDCCSTWENVVVVMNSVTGSFLLVIGIVIFIQFRLGVSLQHKYYFMIASGILWIFKDFAAAMLLADIGHWCNLGCWFWVFCVLWSLEAVWFMVVTFVGLHRQGEVEDDVEARPLVRPTRLDLDAVRPAVSEGDFILVASLLGVTPKEVTDPCLFCFQVRPVMTTCSNPDVPHPHCVACLADWVVTNSMTSLPPCFCKKRFT